VFNVVAVHETCGALNRDRPKTANRRQCVFEAESTVRRRGVERTAFEVRPVVIELAQRIGGGPVCDVTGTCRPSSSRADCCYFHVHGLHAQLTTASTGCAAVFVTSGKQRRRRLKSTQVPADSALEPASNIITRAHQTVGGATTQLSEAESFAFAVIIRWRRTSAAVLADTEWTAGTIMYNADAEFRGFVTMMFLKTFLTSKNCHSCFAVQR